MREAIEKELLEYLKKEVIAADAAVALDASTPLLDSGLVDSFALVNLVAHIEKIFFARFNLEELDPAEFSTVSNLAEAVARRIDDLPKAAPTQTGWTAGGACVRYVKPESNRLIVFFTGGRDWYRAPWMLDVLRATGLYSHNVLMLRELRAVPESYHRGVSEAYPSLDAIAQIVRDELAASFPHVRHVYTMGTSSGALPALHCGLALQAEAVWSMGGRIARADSLPRAIAVLERIYPLVTGEALPKHIAHDNQQRLHDFLAQPEWAAERRTLHDFEQVIDLEVLGALAARIAAAPGRTTFYFWFDVKDVIDRRVAEAFRGPAHVVLKPIDAEPRHIPPSTSVAMGTHLALVILHNQGVLGELFRPHF